MAKKAENITATGRRKTSVARVWLKEHRGGELTVNGLTIADYFQRNPLAEVSYLQPFLLTNTLNRFAGTIKVTGSGTSGQLGAVVHGLSRALEKYNPEFRLPLKQAGLLTRDARETERKKYFLLKARKRPQYSKR